MKQITNPETYEISRFDGVTCSTVYRGGFSSLKYWDNQLKWREDEALGEALYKPYQVLTLSEIAKQMSGSMVTIFVDGPMLCEVIQYGNYGDKWFSIGTITGYA